MSAPKPRAEGKDTKLASTKRRISARSTGVKGQPPSISEQLLDGYAQHLGEAVQFNIRYRALLVLDPGNGTTADIDRKGLQSVRKELERQHLELREEIIRDEPIEY